ncbi:MAG: type II toxin-antitoxin system VapB family antitoxin [Acidobacteria bacterium]|nr:type II toxin-antitoxin system VapB family antitoxin [Acidobacteriota bacterium]
MRTTLALDERLLDEVKTLSGAKTKKEAIERAMTEFIQRRRFRKLLDLEGKVELAYTVEELIKRRRKDVPHR